MFFEVDLRPMRIRKQLNNGPTRTVLNRHNKYHNCSLKGINIKQITSKSSKMSSKTENSSTSWQSSENTFNSLLTRQQQQHPD